MEHFMYIPAAEKDLELVSPPPDFRFRILTRRRLSHSILVGFAQLAEFSAEFNIDFEIQIAFVAIIWFHAKFSSQFLVFLARDVIF